MRNLLLPGLLIILSVIASPQTIPNLLTPIGVGSAEVWGDSIYHFGGGTSWSGSTRFATIYKYDSTGWHDYVSMPDNDVWGISTAIKGDSVFVYGGYAFGNNKLRMYDILSNTWEYLANSPNISATYGHTIEYVNGYVYLFFNGNVYKYNLSTNSWSQATSLSVNASWLFSTVYQGEVYLVGWTNAQFYKYNPASNQWIQLADLPYFVSGGALKCVDNKIYTLEEVQAQVAAHLIIPSSMILQQISGAMQIFLLVLTELIWQMSYTKIIFMLLVGLMQMEMQ